MKKVSNPSPFKKWIVFKKLTYAGTNNETDGDNMLCLFDILTFKLKNGNYTSFSTINFFI